MIRKIYIDNFRCLSNFEIKPYSCQLWLGDNGSGKSSVLDAVRNIQRVLSGKEVRRIFEAQSLTAWDKRREQTFRLAVDHEQGLFEYKLIVEQRAHDSNEAVIKHEELQWKGQSFYLFDGSDVHLYRINSYTAEVEEGTSFPARGGRSMLATIDARDDNKPLVSFREAVTGWLLVQPLPTGMSHLAAAESSYLESHCGNFASWYRHILQENPKIAYKANEQLGEVLPGFEQLKMKEAGDARKLLAVFRIDNVEYDFDFSQLSDGQRQLIALYTLLEALRCGFVGTLFIDEPDNNVTLREIQPWINTLRDICDENGPQAVVISHHPEIIDIMGKGEEVWFHRANGGPVQTDTYPTTPGLTPAETMARGWDDG